MNNINKIHMKFLITFFLLFLSIKNNLLSAANNLEQKDSADSFNDRLKILSIPEKYRLPEITIGNQNAKNHLIIYSSFTCPYCREFHLNLLKKFIAKHLENNTIKITFKNYIDDQGSMEAALLARYFSKSTKKYMEYYDMIFENQKKWMSSNDPANYLKKIFLQSCKKSQSNKIKNNINEESISKAIENKEILAGLMLDQQDAHKLNIVSSPAFLVLYTSSEDAKIKNKLHIGKISLEQLEQLCNLSNI